MLPVDDTQQDPPDADFPQVDLVYFKAEPSTIAPFGISLLKWKVEGTGAFRVQLNGQDVTKTGERAVQPVNTGSYRLTALARNGAVASLGTVTVTVAIHLCETLNPIADLNTELRVLVRDKIKEMIPEARFRSEPVVNCSSGRIDVRLRLTKPENNLPDADVDVDASFGLTVVDGVVVTFAEQVSVDISVPWWVWFVPIASFGVALAIAIAKDNAEQDMRRAIKDIGRYIDARASLYTPESKRIHSIRVEEHFNGTLLITYCPDQLLHQFALISDFRQYEIGTG